jgi:SAM-dependent methyltransferase
MLDAGTGDGGAMTLRDWPEPGRPDIKMFARAGDSSPGFSNHTGSEIGWWPAEPPQFGGKKFDAIFCCNFIEHIDEPLTFIARAIDTLAPNGRIFLEWPKPESISLPTTGDLASFGVSVTTCAYHDDRTHREAPPPQVYPRSSAHFRNVVFEYWSKEFHLYHSSTGRSPFTRDSNRTSLQ